MHLHGKLYAVCKGPRVLPSDGAAASCRANASICPYHPAGGEVGKLALYKGWIGTQVLCTIE